MVVDGSSGSRPRSREAPNRGAAPPHDRRQRTMRPRRHLRPLWVGLTIVILALAAIETVLLYRSHRRPVGDRHGPPLLPVRGPTLARHRGLLHRAPAGRSVRDPDAGRQPLSTARALPVRPVPVPAGHPVVGHPARRHRLCRLVVPAGRPGCGRSWRSSCCSPRPPARSSSATPTCGSRRRSRAASAGRGRRSS